MRGSLKASATFLVLDLGRVERLATESGPARARYVAIVRTGREGRLAAREAALLRRRGLPAEATLFYATAADPLDFELADGGVVVGGVAVFPEGPPALVFTPYYAWLEEAWEDSWS